MDRRTGSWNPTTGCSIVSRGCHNCYAMSMATRLVAMGSSKYEGTASDGRWTGQVNLVKSALTIPLKTKKPTVWFVNSMSDLFHEAIPFEFIDQVFDVMTRCPQHTFQILTKRSARMKEYVTQVKRSSREDNVWLGVSVEDFQRTDRINDLVETPAAGKFISAEPLLEEVDFALRNWVEECPVDWMIVGGESGPGARPFYLDWARLIIEDCELAGVPCFIKQLGAKPMTTSSSGVSYPLALKSRKGNDPTEWPTELRVRQSPFVRENILK